MFGYRPVHLKGGFKSLQTLFEGEFDKAIDEGGEIMENAVRNEIIRSDAIGSRTLLEHITHRRIVEGNGRLLLDVIPEPGVTYPEGQDIELIAAVVEGGRVESEKPVTVSFARSMVWWMKQRGITPREGNTDADYWSAAWAMATVIQAEGLEGRYPFKKAFRRSKFRVIAAFNRAVKRATKKWNSQK